MSIINGDLLRLRTFQFQHTHDLAMCGHTIGAEIRGGANQEDVLLLLSTQCAVLKQDRRHKVDLGIDKIRSADLGRKEIRQKTKLLSDGGKSRKVLLVVGLILYVCHHAPSMTQQTAAEVSRL